jgi:hypothetical protein
VIESPQTGPAKAVMKTNRNEIRRMSAPRYIAVIIAMGSGLNRQGRRPVPATRLPVCRKIRYARPVFRKIDYPVENVITKSTFH